MYQYLREITMQILEKRDNSEKNSEKKSYIQPQLKEIGKVNNVTKGSSGLSLDGFSVSLPGS